MGKWQIIKRPPRLHEEQSSPLNKVGVLLGYRILHFKTRTVLANQPGLVTLLCDNFLRGWCFQIQRIWTTTAILRGRNWKVVRSNSEGNPFWLLFPAKREQLPKWAYKFLRRYLRSIWFPRSDQGNHRAKKCVLAMCFKFLLHLPSYWDSVHLRKAYTGPLKCKSESV